jgi:tetratricopeptide (TPR) repeat protein
MWVIEPDIDNVRLAWQTGLAQPENSLGNGPLLAALTPLSIYYQLRGLAYEAEAIMQTTANTAAESGSDGLPLAIRAGLERARFQNRLGRYRPAIQTIQTALKQVAQHGDVWAEGMVHVLWGESLWRLGEYETAESKLNHALNIAQTIHATEIIGWCHHHLGIINDIKSRYAAAHDHLKQACTAWRELDNAQTLSNSLNSIGLVCYHQGNLAAAQDAMEQALTICNQLDNRHLQSSLLNNLSMVSTERGDYLGAKYYLQLGLELAIANSNLTVQGQIYNNLGQNYFRLGEIATATQKIEKCLKIAELLGDRPLMAEALTNLAETKREQGLLTSAKSIYIEALEIAQQDNLQHLECSILIRMAELLNETNRSKARQYIAKAVLLANTIQNPNLLEQAKSIDSYLVLSQNLNE